MSRGEGIQPLNEKMKNLDLGGLPANETGAACSLVHLQTGAEAKTVKKTETGLSRLSALSLNLFYLFACLNTAKCLANIDQCVLKTV